MAVQAALRAAEKLQRGGNEVIDKISITLHTFGSSLVVQRIREKNHSLHLFETRKMKLCEEKGALEKAWPCQLVCEVEMID